MQPLQLTTTHDSDTSTAQVPPALPPQLKLATEYAGRTITVQLPESHSSSASPAPNTPRTPMESPIAAAATLDLTNPHLDADTLRQEIAKVKNLKQIQELKL